MALDSLIERVVSREQQFGQSSQANAIPFFQGAEDDLGMLGGGAS